MHPPSSHFEREATAAGRPADHPGPASDEIARRIAALPRWHYEFDLKGHRTPIRDPTWVNRHRQRREYLVPPLVRAAGGSLRGMRVLDLGCNAGYWSLAALEEGADFVLGVDARAMHIEQAGLVFEAKGIDPGSYRFVERDVFELDLTQFGEFDIVLCLGLLYHVRYPMELVELTARATRLALIDTAVKRPDKPILFLETDLPLSDPRSATDRQLVMVPTARAVGDMATAAGFASIVQLEPRFTDYTGAQDYEQGGRRAFLCAKGTVEAGEPPELAAAPRDDRGAGPEAISRPRAQASSSPGGADELSEARRLGHREFVGGLWEQIGQLQFDFMRARGLRPEHVLLDIGCGSLRGGARFIPYLGRGNYLGLDKSRELIEAGLAHELDDDLVADRAPELVVSARFEFERFSRRPDFALAQSLFTHLTLEDIALCLRRLRDNAPDGCRLYATFFEASEPVANPKRSHSRENFLYTREQLASLAAKSDWTPRYIGDWRHPRGQMMMLFEAGGPGVTGAAG